MCLFIVMFYLLYTTSYSFTDIRHLSWFYFVLS
uniref:Uncharacterized protein n=1 Tax=Anguilla anguilla TaxID=7936 RepID=A0A0E9RXE4_ANGAN